MKDNQKKLNETELSNKQVVVSFTTSAELIQRVKLISVQKGLKLKECFRDALEIWIKEEDTTSF